MGFYLHMIDEPPARRETVDHLLDHEELVTAGTLLGLAVAGAATLWQLGVVQAVWAALTGA